MSQKLAKCTVCTVTAQPARTGGAQTARVWPCRGSPAGRVVGVVPRASAVSQRARRRVAGPQWPYRGRKASCRGLASWPCRDTVPAPSLAPYHNTPRCIATQTPLSLASVTIHHVYCNTDLTNTTPAASVTI